MNNDLIDSPDQKCLAVRCSRGHFVAEYWRQSGWNKDGSKCPCNPTLPSGPELDALVARACRQGRVKTHVLQAQSDVLDR